MIDSDRRPVRLRRFLLLPALAAVSVLVGVPVAMLLRSSFMPGDGPVQTSGWSLRHYQALFADPFLIKVIVNTLAAGLAVAAVTAVIGFPLAYLLARSSERMRRLKLVVLILPLALSLVVNVFGWMVILGRSGLVNALMISTGVFESPQQMLYSWGAVLTVLTHTFLPFQVLCMMGVIVQIDPALEQAAASLRASRWTTFRRVVIPLALPGIVAGSTIVFMLTISAFVTPRMMGGTKVQMLGSLIYQQVMIVLNWSFAGAMSVVLLLLSVGIPAIVGRIAGRANRRPAVIGAGA
jgi:putative spermidine/putrescine transport system permease protein